MAYTDPRYLDADPLTMRLEKEAVFAFRRLLRGDASDVVFESDLTEDEMLAQLDADDAAESDDWEPLDGDPATLLAELDTLNEDTDG